MALWCRALPLDYAATPQDLETNAASVSLLPPVEEAVRQTPLAAASAGAAGGRLPRLEEYTVGEQCEWVGWGSPPGPHRILESDKKWLWLS